MRLSRKVRCVSDVAYNSHWGCHFYISFKVYPLNVIVTDRQDIAIFPLQQFSDKARVRIAVHQVCGGRSINILTSWSSPTLTIRCIYTPIWSSNAAKTCRVGCVLMASPTSWETLQPVLEGLQVERPHERSPCFRT